MITLQFSLLISVLFIMIQKLISNKFQINVKQQEARNGKKKDEFAYFIPYKSYGNTDNL